MSREWGDAGRAVLIAGIDEAGYGPRLGPLCVGFSAFRLEREGGETPDLWEALGPDVGRWEARRSATLLVDDSKKLKRSGAQPLRELEKTALAHLAQLGIDAPDDVAALAALGVEAPATKLGAIGFGSDGASRGIVANVLRAKLNAGGVRVEALGVDAASAARFNELWRRTRSKAAMELEMIGPRLRWVWERSEGGSVVSLDRLGGRTRYLAALAAAVPDAEIEEVDRRDERVACRLTGDGREMLVEVLVGGDGRRYATALASVLAKWSRELVMARFNRAFAEIAPELKPTAGYGTDANRWIREARERLGRDVVDPLVRLA